MCGTIKYTFENTREDTKMIFFLTITISTLIFRRETWTHTKIYKRKIESSQLKIFGNVQGCTTADKTGNNYK